MPHIGRLLNSSVFVSRSSSSLPSSFSSVQGGIEKGLKKGNFFFFGSVNSLTFYRTYHSGIRIPYRTVLTPLHYRKYIMSDELKVDNESPVASSSTGSNRRYRIYTKTGDKGTSSLFNGERKNKDCEFFEALGDVDELNGNIGLATEYILQYYNAQLQKYGLNATTTHNNITSSSITSPTLSSRTTTTSEPTTLSSSSASPSSVPSSLLPIVHLLQQLQEIQSRLLDIGSAIATPLDSSRPDQLEKVIFDSQNTVFLEQYIDTMEEKLPPLKNFILPSGGLPSSALHISRSVCRRAERRAVTLVNEGKLNNNVAIYLNRLSDYLFVAARFIAMETGYSEQVYKKSTGLATRSLQVTATAEK